LALEDAQVARAMLPGNPLVLARSVYASLTAAGLYERKGRSGDHDRAVAQAGRYVQEMERFPSSVFAAQTRFHYLVYVGDEDAACQLMQQDGTEIGLVPMLLYFPRPAPSFRRPIRSSKVGI